MGLLAIKDYLTKVKLASLANLCAHFNYSNQDVLRDMLDHWIRKGKVRCFLKTPFCGGKCVKCDKSIVEIYEWI